MKILLLASAYNGLTQRAHVALNRAGYDVSIELALSPRLMLEAVALFEPDMIICPYLKERVPKEIWDAIPTIIIHPGIEGDRGPSSLDWAILEGEKSWGVTALQAVNEMDAGPVWATRTFPLRSASKGSIYRNEVTEAAIDSIFETIKRFEKGGYSPQLVNYDDPAVQGRPRPRMKQVDRKIDWASDDTETILRKIRAADPAPGLQDELCGLPILLFGAQAEDSLKGAPKSFLAQRHGAICLGTVDGAVWISHLKQVNRVGKRFFKLPAADVLAPYIEQIPTVAPPHDAVTGSYRDIWYEERGSVGVIHFDFYNGAMGVEQCERLRMAYLAALSRPTRIVVLLNRGDFWSNGIDLNRIEAADSPPLAAWRNILAMNDLIEAIITNRTHLTVTAMNGNAGAGGVTLGLAADIVLLREGSVLNPHYRGMGLFGSEYWTYLLPKRVGQEKSIELMHRCLPIGSAQAVEIGLADQQFPAAGFKQHALNYVATLSADEPYFKAWEEMVDGRDQDEEIKQLPLYRAFELNFMWQNFYSPNSRFSTLRRDFVFKKRPDSTPIRIARHRWPQETPKEWVPGCGVEVALPDPSAAGIQLSDTFKKECSPSSLPLHSSSS